MIHAKKRSLWQVSLQIPEMFRKWEHMQSAISPKPSSAPRVITLIRISRFLLYQCFGVAHQNALFLSFEVLWNICKVDYFPFQIRPLTFKLTGWQCFSFLHNTVYLVFYHHLQWDRIGRTVYSLTLLCECQSWNNSHSQIFILLNIYPGTSS